MLGVQGQQGVSNTDVARAVRAAEVAEVLPAQVFLMICYLLLPNAVPSVLRTVLLKIVAHLDGISTARLVRTNTLKHATQFPAVLRLFLQRS